MEQITQENKQGYNFAYCFDNKPFPKKYLEVLRGWGFFVEQSVRLDKKRYMLHVEWKREEQEG
jgi:hypothetical protein